VRRGYPPEHGQVEEVRRVGQGSEAEETGRIGVLAYVFSHRPAPDADINGYEEVLRRFHAALAELHPHGFVRSLTYRVGSGYSDWYVLEDSSALDHLNVAAVSGGRAASHDAAARMAAAGVGRLMSLAAGDLDVDAGYEVRFAKPAGVGYAELYSTLERWTHEPGTSLWRRMMVLGPPPEFTLVSMHSVELPAEMQPEPVSRAIV